MSHVAPSSPPRRADPFRWVVEHPGVVDAIMFGGAAFVVLLFALATGTWGGWLPFSVLMIAAGAFGRTRPDFAALVIGVLAVVHFIIWIPAVLGDAMIFYALYCATAHGRARTRRLALAAALVGALMQGVGVGVLFVANGDISSLSDAVQALVSVAAVSFVGIIAVVGTWAIGRYQQARIDQVRLARERAAQAEREREHRAALAVADERARIAREMHDVVAHSLSVIIAQADGGRFIASQKPEQAVAVLDTIGQTGRSALADMRSLLGVLRGDEETSFGPQPDLTTLPELLRRVRAAGLDVEDDVAGRFEDLPPSLGLSMFRLVQEALTNVLKHAGPGAAARVRVHRTGGELTIDVIDDGQGIDPDSDGHGHGLTGMRERVALHGGTLTAGPLPAGGFRVSARVPLAGAPEASVQGSPSSAQPAATPTPSPIALARTPDPLQETR